ncbi:3-ketoacyl-CoA thiolase A, peroxisomal [Microtus ochrogaster]|uniref:acetyl-CoA C-acetyltransferase n=1 Tax=Microtus ochrogaster TaxID=79684 RepID=A0A8J6KYB3_MICOH|nr:3-ketoacyl-CoA thiolase A, peroxisomal [Microtus ochrogaster]
MHRLQVVLGHLAGRPESSSALQAAPCSAGFPQASASDVVVVHGRRTPIGRSGRGGFKSPRVGMRELGSLPLRFALQDTTPDELLSAVLTAVLQDLNLRPEQLGDISVGNVLQPGAGAVMARIGQFLSGIPETVPLSTVNRQCSSGLQAVANIAGLTVNDIDIFEINEAFASQALYCVEKLGIPAEKVNPLGGAIALGHPLGCTGARQVITLLNELKRRGKRILDTGFIVNLKGEWLSSHPPAPHSLGKAGLGTAWPVLSTSLRDTPGADA